MTSCADFLLRRLHVRDVAIRGRWPSQCAAAAASSTATPSAAAVAGKDEKKILGLLSDCVKEADGTGDEDDSDGSDSGISAEVCVREFMSESVGEHFK